MEDQRTADTTEPEPLLVEVRDRVGYLTINRPRVSNALDARTSDLLVSTLDELEHRDDVWIIVLRGAGDRSFCAGRDLKELNSQGIETPMGGLVRNKHEAVLETYKPTVAVLNGAAVGGGCELALACDLRIAAPHATIGLPEAKRGMGANFASVILPRMLPRGRAFEMLYTGRTLSAQEAHDWGLVNWIAEPGALGDEVDRRVAELLTSAPLSLQRYKHMVTKGWEMSVPAALRLNAGPNPYRSKDATEGVRAFVEKRSPQWQAE